MLLNNITSDERLLPVDHWTAIERTHYMGSSKVFVLVDRPFWKDIDPATGREVMSMTLTDRMSRGTYLLDHGDDKPGLICLSYTWADDSLKLLPLDATARMEIMLRSLRQIYPDVDIRSHIIAPPVTVTWEAEPAFMGAFKANLPGHYRYQERLFTHFMQDDLPERATGPVPRRRRRVLDRRLGRGRGHHRLERRVGRHAPLRRRHRPGEPRAGRRLPHHRTPPPQ